MPRHNTIFPPYVPSGPTPFEQLLQQLAPPGDFAARGLGVIPTLPPSGPQESLGGLISGPQPNQAQATISTARAATAAQPKTPQQPLPALNLPNPAPGEPPIPNILQEQFGRGAQVILANPEAAADKFAEAGIEPPDFEAQLPQFGNLIPQDLNRVDPNTPRDIGAPAPEPKPKDKLEALAEALAAVKAPPPVETQLPVAGTPTPPSARVGGGGQNLAALLQLIAPPAAPRITPLGALIKGG